MKAGDGGSREDGTGAIIAALKQEARWQCCVEPPAFVLHCASCDAVELVCVAHMMLEPHQLRRHAETAECTDPTAARLYYFASSPP